MSLRAHFPSLDRAVRQKPLSIAHRGASAYAPENSLAGLRKAAEMQADMVEVDLRITSDSRPVIAHDSNLRRIYGISQDIRELPLKTLQARTNTASTEPVPTFEEVAFLCSALKLSLYVDIKEFNRLAFETVFRTLQVYQLYDHVILASFRPDWIGEIKALNPQVRTSILFNSIYVEPVKLAQSVQANYVHPCWESVAPEPHRLLTQDWLKSVRDAGLGIITWHEERPNEIESLINLGVDGICTDKPDLLVSLLA